MKFNIWLKRFLHYWCPGAICSTVSLSPGIIVWSLIIISIASLLLSLDDLTVFKRLNYQPVVFGKLFFVTCIIAFVLTAVINILLYREMH